MNLFKRKYPVADYIAKYGLYLPSGLALTIDQIDFSADAVKEVLSER